MRAEQMKTMVLLYDTSCIYEIVILNYFLKVTGKEMIFVSPEVWEYLKNVHDSNGRIAAICAGVDVLEHAGLLEDAESIHSCEKDVVTSHRITTSRANGYVDFAIEVAKQMELFEDEADLRETIAFWREFQRIESN